MCRFPDLYILRHGQTQWNLERKFQGQQNSPLTAQGKSQALAQRDILDHLPRRPKDVFVSPLGRTFETATLAMPWAKEIWQLDDRLREIRLGEWEGRDIDQPKAEENPNDAVFDWIFNSPGGENFEDMAARVNAFLDALTAPAVLVTHGINSKILRGLYLGLPLAEMLRLPSTQGCVFHVHQGGHDVLLQKSHP